MAGIDEGVQQPELDIFDVGSLEVVGVQLAHHSTPALIGVAQRTVGIDIGIQVVGAAFLRIVGQVEHVERIGGSAVGRLVAVGIELVHVDGSDVVVRQLVEVALDMGWRQAGRAVGEQRVDVIPGQQRTVEAAGHRVVGILAEISGHTGEHPRLRFRDADAVLGTLEVVDIRGIVLCAACRTCYQMGKLARKGDLRGLGAMQEGQLVEHTCEPLALLLPVDVQTPQRVLQRLRTHRHLRRQRLL